MKKERNYAWFYSLLKRVPGADKETLVYGITDGRTTSLRETTCKEYVALCRKLQDMEGESWYVRERRKKRSELLHQMQLLGVDTKDWTRVDAFCLDPRICGKRFSWMDIKELAAASVRVRAISRKQDKRKVAESNGKGEKTPSKALQPAGHVMILNLGTIKS